MTCLAVRDRFPEYALGTLIREERAEVERHLAFCAACRKETSELQGAASVLAFALRPAEPEGQLEPRVVEAVASVAARPPRRTRSAVAAVLAWPIAGPPDGHDSRSRERTRCRFFVTDCHNI